MFLNFLEKKQSNMLAIFVKFADVLLYFFCGLLAYYIQFGSLALGSYYQLAFLFAVIAVVPVFSVCGVYRPIRGTSFVRYFHLIYVALLSLMMLLASIAFIMKVGELYSRAWFLLWNLHAFIAFTLFRIGLLLTLRRMRKRGLNQKRIVIIGSGATVEEIIRRINQSLWTGFKVVALFSGDVLSDVNILGNAVVVQSLPSNIEEFISQNNVAEVWLVLSLWDKPVLEKLRQDLNNCVVNVRYFPAISGVDLLNYSITEVLGLPVINVVSSPMVGGNRLIKAIEDRVLAFFILILISPLMLVIALLVKFSSPGPVFYRQLRHGWDGKPINVYKFRTMYVHQEKGGVLTQAARDDIRITKIGKILRRISFDELPQFINVLQGRMSIVGPRPHAVEHNEYYKNLITSYMLRHHVKPGITGWAQVNGWRGETDTLDKMQKRIEHDIYYINHWSLGFDLKIIFLTIFKGFVNKNAY